MMGCTPSGCSCAVCSYVADLKAIERIVLYIQCAWWSELLVDVRCVFHTIPQRARKPHRCYVEVCLMRHGCMISSLGVSDMRPMCVAHTCRHSLHAMYDSSARASWSPKSLYTTVMTTSITSWHHGGDHSAKVKRDAPSYLQGPACIRQKVRGRY